MLALLVWRQRRPAIQLQFDEVGAWCVQGELTQFAQLVYRNDYWLVLKLSNPLEPNLLKRLMWSVVRRHHLVFRDQFSKGDYREARSRLSAAKFMNGPAPKNEF
ncbi:hypothetical protein [Marinomonas ostreistagni]|uniref:hypothetical protein n=1 Tax=Marinomonas ostreistagni TaxID=359209 RepID=UPI00194FEA0D|nr:hypothetical protein [Marinomonas ostreistagni]MBM6551396.1 hypothetical protein [Marinomonas ostreistagni]